MAWQPSKNRNFSEARVSRETTEFETTEFEATEFVYSDHDAFEFCLKKISVCSKKIYEIDNEMQVMMLMLFVFYLFE